MSVKNLAEVLLVGLPNSGKSTLFNRLTHSRAAITSATAHTTRDTNIAIAKYGDSSFHVVDTAGYTKDVEDIKQAAMQLMQSRLGTASVVVFVVDGTTLPSQADKDLVKSLHKTGLPLILAINKSDQVKMFQDEGEFRKLGISQMYAISAHQNEGMVPLLDAIVERIPKKPLPRKPASIKIALLGRPNVGKSSLLNAFAGETLAIESATAHTTRDTNSFSLNFFGQAIEIVDTAGLRRPGKIGRKEAIEFYSSVRTKKAIEEADICLVLIDVTEPLATQDQRIIGMVKDANKACILVATKWDAVKKDTHTMAAITQKLRSELQFMYWAPLVFTSAKSYQNLEELKKLILDVYTRLDFSIRTPQLNRFIEDANALNPPSAVKTRRPKVNYATQTGNRPPKFTLFCTHPQQMHWSYTRFLQNRLREQFDLNGVPVIIEYRSKYKEPR